jgi:type II secretory pathway pseudopilin PulG
MVELLVTVFISGITLASVTQFFAIQSHAQKGHSYRLEAQQALRASIDAITRDLRLAGACLPSGGQFPSVAGTDAAAGDTITIRTGQVRNNLSCIVGTVGTAVAAGVTTLTLADVGAGVNATNGFAPDMLVHLDPPASPGEEVFVASVSPTQLTFTSPTTLAYPVGAGVYPLDERLYSLNKTDPQNPLLTLTIDRGAAQAFAVGVEDMQIQYLLDRNCPTCDVIDLPPDAATWWLVNEVYLTMTVKTVGSVRPEDSATLVATSHAKPRNLLP